MPMEIEAKAYAKDLKKLEEKILSLGAKLAWQGEQIDTYYNHPCRNFAQTDEALRIRQAKDKVVLTYKGPKIDTISKTREEIKVEIQDVISAGEVLAKLGFKEVATVKKNRAEFTLDIYKVCLDSVENLGDFVEVEVQASMKDSDEKVSEIRDSIIKTMHHWGLEKTERISYLELLLAKEK